MILKTDNNGIWTEDTLLEQIPIMMEIVTETITNEDGATEEIETERPLLDVEGNAQLDPQYVAEPIPSGMYAVSGVCPQWNGTQWTENVQRPILEPTAPQLSTDEKLTQMAEQLFITQTELEDAQIALDFLLMGGI